MIGADGTRKDPNISQDRIRNSEIVRPPLHEQKLIAEYVERECFGTDIVIKEFTHQINLIREYRTRLIADVVTGKIDVRDAVYHLPPGFEDDSDPLIDLSDTDSDILNDPDYIDTVEDMTDED